MKSSAAIVVGIRTTKIGIQTSRLIRPSGRLIAADQARAEDSGERSPLIQSVIGRSSGQVRQRLRKTATRGQPERDGPDRQVLLGEGVVVEGEQGERADGDEERALELERQIGRRVEATELAVEPGERGKGHVDPLGLARLAGIVP